MTRTGIRTLAIATTAAIALGSSLGCTSVKSRMSEEWEAMKRDFSFRGTDKMPRRADVRGTPEIVDPRPLIGEPYGDEPAEMARAPITPSTRPTTPSPAPAIAEPHRSYESPGSSVGTLPVYEATPTEPTTENASVVEISPPAPAPAPPPAPKTYRVKRGDSLSKIASAVYGDGRRWRKIYDANRSILRGPDHVRIGQILTIPE